MNTKQNLISTDRRYLFTSANGHSPVGGSSLHRVLRCPGSVEANHGRVDKGSAAAAEGTTAHEVCEHMFLARAARNGGKVGDDSTLVPEEIKQGADPEMVAHAARFLQYVIDTAGPDAELYVEHPANYEGYIPNGRALVDLIAVTHTALHVYDYKYGMGKVDATENEQLLGCALGADEELSLRFDYEQIEVHIVQPRIGHLDAWSVPDDRLDVFRDQLRAATAVILAGDAPRTPGSKQCQWCRSSGDCKEQRDATFALVSGEFDDVQTSKLSAEDMAEALDKLGMVEGFVKAVKARALDDLRIGKKIPGYKLVRGRRGARQWDSFSDDELKRLLTEQGLTDDTMYVKKLVSPTQAEKAGADVSALAVQSEGTLTFAHETDKRPQAPGS